MISMLTMIKTSFKERARQHSFWLMIGTVVVLAILCTPRFNTGIKILSLDPKIFRQADNPTWLPICAALIFGFTLPFFGVGAVENALQTDRTSGVWPWIATTRFARISYGLALFVGNFLVLLSMWFVTLLATGLMVVIRFPGQGISFATFLSPFLALLPSMALIAALALLVESVTAKRSSGLVTVFMFGLLYVYATQLSEPHAFWHRLLSLSGLTSLQDTVSRASEHVIGRPIDGIQMFSSYAGQQGKLSLHFGPVAFDRTTLAFMLGEVLIAVGIALVAALLMHKARQTGGLKVRHQVQAPASSASVPADYVPIQAGHFQWLQLLQVEAKRQWHIGSWRYRALLLGSWLLVWFVPTAAQQEAGLPIVWLLALPWLSALGSSPRGWQSWLHTVPAAIQHQKWAELLVSGGLALVIMVPFIVRKPSVALQLILVAVATVALAQGMGSLLNSGHLLALLMALFWFFYMNGLTGMISPTHFSLIVCVVFAGLFIVGLALTELANRRRSLA